MPGQPCICAGILLPSRHKNKNINLTRVLIGISVALFGIALKYLEHSSLLLDLAMPLVILLTPLVVINISFGVGNDLSFGFG